MGWFAMAIVISVLVAFNLYASNAIVKLNRDQKETHKTLLNLEKYIKEQSK
jgi:hypothetical protein